MRLKKNLASLWLVLILLTAIASAEAEYPENAYPYMVRKLEMVHEYGQYEFWPLEQKAELDALAQSLLIKESGDRFHAVPATEHLTMEQARTAAEAILSQRFHVDEQVLANCVMMPEFFTEGESVFWKINLTESMTFSEGVNTYIAAIDAVTGEPGHCEILPYQLFWDFNNALPYPYFEGDITRDQAVEIAHKTILDNHLGLRGLDADLLALYTPYMGSYVDDELGRILFVEYNPLDSELFDYFGSYMVIMDPITGIVWRSGKSNG